MVNTRSLSNDPPTAREFVDLKKQVENYDLKTDARFLRMESQLAKLPWIVIGLFFTFVSTIATLIAVLKT